MNLPPLSGRINHPALGVVDYSIQEVVDDPDQQVAQVIGLMRKYAQEDARNPAIQGDITHKAAMCGGFDPVSDTFGYLKRDGLRGMKFVRDEITALPFQEFERTPGGWRPFVESIARPELLAQSPNPHGDCDCFATYGAAHLTAQGIPCSFATVAADSIDPLAYSHVYLVAYPKSGRYAGMRVPMDLSHGPYLGWEVGNPFGKFCEWPVRRSMLLPVALLVGGAYLLYKAVN